MTASHGSALVVFVAVRGGTRDRGVCPSTARGRSACQHRAGGPSGSSHGSFICWSSIRHLLAVAAAPVTHSPGGWIARQLPGSSYCCVVSSAVELWLVAGTQFPKRQQRSCIYQIPSDRRTRAKFPRYSTHMRGSTYFPSLLSLGRPSPTPSTGTRHAPSLFHGHGEGVTKVLCAGQGAVRLLPSNGRTRGVIRHRLLPPLCLPPLPRLFGSSVSRPSRHGPITLLDPSLSRGGLVLRSPSRGLGSSLPPTSVSGLHALQCRLSTSLLSIEFACLHRPVSFHSLNCLIRLCRYPTEPSP